MGVFRVRNAVRPRCVVLRLVTREVSVVEILLCLVSIRLRWVVAVMVCRCMRMLCLVVVVVWVRRRVIVSCILLCLRCVVSNRVLIWDMRLIVWA